MASNTSNVKLGVCKITFGGQDLGYTKGGVEVSVTTNTHPVTVDQFGETVVNEYITKRELKIKCPLAETTLDNLVATMPGATLVSDGAKATGTITFTTNPVAATTVTINGVVFTFKATATVPTDVLIGASATASVANLAAALNASNNILVGLATYSVASLVLTATYDLRGTDGNAFTLATSVSGATVSGATLTGGTNPTKQRVDSTSGIGVNLLSVAKPLLLHPIALATSNESEDFLIPLASTPGAMNFVYKHDNERVFNIDFMGYPDPVTGILFKLGDSAAV
jgi:hypothetical protein